jgi:hypothetical protein
MPTKLSKTQHNQAGHPDKRKLQHYKGHADITNFPTARYRQAYLIYPPRHCSRNFSLFLVKRNFLGFVHPQTAAATV